MAKEDSRNEFALSLLQRAWQENHGNFLLVVGIIVSVLAWTIGYFQLIPDIRATSRPYSQSIFSTGIHYWSWSTIVPPTKGTLWRCFTMHKASTKQQRRCASKNCRFSLARQSGESTTCRMATMLCWLFTMRNGNDQIDVGERQGLSHNPDLPVEPDLETGRALTKVSTFAFDGPDKQISVHLR